MNKPRQATARQDYLLDQLGDVLADITAAQKRGDAAAYLFHQAERTRIRADLNAEYWKPRVTVR